MHLKVVFTALQFTSYRSYGEACNRKTQSEGIKTEIEPDLQIFWCYSLHMVVEGLKLVGPRADVVLQ